MCFKLTITKIKNYSDLISFETYMDKLKSIIKKEFSLSYEEFAVLTYINDTDEEEYHLKKIINKLNYKQPQIVKAGKNLSQQDYFTKRRNEYDERTILILINKKQRKYKDNVIAKIETKTAN